MSRSTVALVSSLVALVISIGNVLFVQRITCTVVGSNVAVYDETPPATSAGRNAEIMWDTLDRRLYC